MMHEDHSGAADRGLGLRHASRGTDVFFFFAEEHEKFSARCASGSRG